MSASPAKPPAAFFVPQLSRDATLSPQAELPRRVSHLLYPPSASAAFTLYLPSSFAQTTNARNVRTHAPRSVTTTVGAGRCPQSNCGGSSTVAPRRGTLPPPSPLPLPPRLSSSSSLPPPPPPRGMRHNAAAAAATTAFDRPPPFFCPSCCVTNPLKTFRLEVRAFRSRVRERARQGCSEERARRGVSRSFARPEERLSVCGNEKI